MENHNKYIWHILIEQQEGQTQKKPMHIILMSIITISQPVQTLEQHTPVHEPAKGISIEKLSF